MGKITDDGIYKSLAEFIMFGNYKTYVAIHEEMVSLGLEFRKGKTCDDISKALRKALHPKNGFLKTEFELSMLEVYLKHDVVKRKRKSV